MMEQDLERDGQMLQNIIRQMHSNDYTTVLQAIQAVRQVLCRSKSPPIDVLIDHGVVPLSVQFLESQSHELQIEAAWVLTNIASGTTEQTMSVVQANAVPKLIELMQSNVSAVADHSVWALCNISGDATICRDTVLMCGAAEEIVKLLGKEQPMTFLRNIAWLISNLCCSRDFARIRILLPAISHLLQHNDTRALTYAAWAINHVTAIDDESVRIEAVVESGCVPSLVRLLGREEIDIVLPVLQSVGNLALGTLSQTDVILAAGALNYMKKLLCTGNSKIVNKTARIISNITAGNVQQIQAVIDAGIFETVRNMMEYGDIRARREAAYVVKNAAIGGTPEQIRYLTRHVRILKPFCDLLQLNDDQLDVVVKDGWEAFLKTAFTFPNGEACSMDFLENLEKIKDLKLN